MVKPLEHILVVSLEQAVAGPFATRQLADLGARVIKIERPGSGDFAREYDRSVHGMSSHFVWLNRSKEAMSLDVKSDAGKSVLRRLLLRADVFLQNLGPGVAHRLGFGSEEVRARFPEIIYCGISGFGTTGPYAGRKAYDLLIQSEAGLLSITGSEAFPARVGISVADIAGGMYAYSGILTALLQRERTGAGGLVEVSLFDALAEWMGFPAYYAGYSGSQPPRTGTRHPTIAPYGDVQVGDGGVVFLSIQNDREWRRFCEVVLEREELANDPRFGTNSRRVENKDALFETIDASLATYDTAEVLQRLADADLAYAQLNDVLDFVRHPQLSERNRWREIDSPVGKLSALLPPANIEGVDPVMGAVPALSEHTEAILRELGYEEREISELREHGTV